MNVYHSLPSPHKEEMKMETTFRPGLEDVVVAETDLSLVDGEGGRLVVRGHSIETLATRRFEDICGLLWDGALPAPPRKRRPRRPACSGRC
jgi:citrate synthase